MITKKDERIFVGIIVGLVIWILALITSMFFWEWRHCIMLWIVVTGIVLITTKGLYRRWYKKMFREDF